MSKMWETPFGYKRGDKHFEKGLKVEKFELGENKGSAFNLEVQENQQMGVQVFEDIQKEQRQAPCEGTGKQPACGGSYSPLDWLLPKVKLRTSNAGWLTVLLI